MRLINNAAIYAAIIAVCVIAALLCLICTLITDIVACFISPIAIAAYAAVITWRYSDETAMSWQTKLAIVQSIFALPSGMVVAISAGVTETLRSKIR